MRHSLVLLALLISLSYASPARAILAIRSNVGAIVSSGVIWSSGKAEAYDTFTGESVYSFTMDGRHRIGEVNAFRYIADEAWSGVYYYTHIEGAPVADRCYQASLEAKVRGTSIERYVQSTEQACYQPLKPTGDKGIDCPDLNCESPIILDMMGDGFRFTGLDRPVSFDIDGDGRRDRVSWTDPAHDDVFLALDRNGNGRIDDGTELFGDSTPQPPSASPSGYRALEVFDESGDGAITSADPVYDALLLWRDADHDGVSQPWEMQPLATAVERISLETVISGRRDAHGNYLHWVSEAEIHGRRGLRCVDVLLRRDDTL